MTAFSPPLHPRPVRSPEKLCRFTSNGAPSSKGESRSRYKGLAWDSRDKRWEVRISVGRFTDQMKAARAYDKAAKKYHGRFARVNLVT